jgi:hypothetical protein
MIIENTDCISSLMPTRRKLQLSKNVAARFRTPSGSEARRIRSQRRSRKRLVQRLVRSLEWQRGVSKQYHIVLVRLTSPREALNPLLNRYKSIYHVYMVLSYLLNARRFTGGPELSCVRKRTSECYYCRRWDCLPNVTRPWERIVSQDINNLIARAEDKETSFNFQTSRITSLHLS